MSTKMRLSGYEPGEGRFAVLGLGNFGTTVARQLRELGNEVLAVDHDDARVQSLAEEFTHVVGADVRDATALEALDIGNFDVVLVAIGEHLESNVLCTLALKDLGVRQVWVKAVSPQHHRILGKLGADRIIQPEFEIGVHVAYSLNYPYVLDYIALGHEQFVVELELTDAVTGRTLAELELTERYGIRFLALKRGRNIVDTGADETPLKTGDQLVVLGRQNDLHKLSDIL